MRKLNILGFKNFRYQNQKEMGELLTKGEKKGGRVGPAKGSG